MSRMSRSAVCIGCGQSFSTMSTRPGFEACSIECRLAGGLIDHGPDLCRTWQHTVDKDGYGEFRFKGQKYKAHRVALEMKLGRPIRPRFEAMHSCDNPPCCNQAHLSEGTTKQNAEDRAAKGRNNTPRGIDAGNSKLNDAEVLEIRASRLSALALAQKFNVKDQCIYKIRARRNWRHIP